MVVGPSKDGDVQLRLVNASQKPVASSPAVGFIEVVTIPGRSIQASGGPSIQLGGGGKTATVCPRGSPGQWAMGGPTEEYRSQ